MVGFIKSEDALGLRTHSIGSFFILIAFESIGIRPT